MNKRCLICKVIYGPVSAYKHTYSYHEGEKRLAESMMEAQKRSIMPQNIQPTGNAIPEEVQVAIQDVLDSEIMWHNGGAVVSKGRLNELAELLKRYREEDDDAG